MPLHHVLSHDPAYLIELAADGFLELERGDRATPFPTPSYLLALRQGGLRDDLVRLAVRRGCHGWFDPPLCIFGELPERLGGSGPAPLTPAERQVLLARLVGTHGGALFARLRRPVDYVGALDRLVGELCAEDVSPAAFAAALEHESLDQPPRDDFERQRDRELAAIYTGYRETLDDARRCDGRDGLVRAARAIRDDPAGLAERLGGRRELRLVGLQDLRGGWRALLAALAESPVLDRVVLYGSVALDLSALGATIDDRRLATSLAGRLFADAPGTRLARSVSGVAAPDAERELEEVARRVRALCDAGVAPHRIAIVSREARPHVDLATDALARLGVPVTARRRMAIVGIPAVRAVLALLDATADGWTRHALVEVAEQPYLDAGVDVHVVNTVGFRRQVRGLAAWVVALTELHEEAMRLERGELPEAEGWEHRATLPSAARMEAAIAALGSLATRARALDGERTLGGWLDWLRGMVTEDTWGVADRLHQLPAEERVDLVRVDLAGWRALHTLVDDWCAAVETWSGADERLDAGAFAMRLRRMLDGDVALLTDTGHGVQVLEGPAAAYRAFDHLFVVGLESGTFPTRAPRSPLLGDWDRERLVEAGLPIDPPTAWEERERELFRVICGGAAEGITLAWAAVDESGREVVRSIFVDEVEEVAMLATETIPLSRVLTPDAPLCGSLAVAAHARRVAAIERLRRGGEPSPWNGVIEDAALLRWIETEFGEGKVWSPTQLEHFAKCPWSYFGERLLRVEVRQEPDDGIEPSVRGRILHRALERYFDLARRERNGAPVLLREDDAPKAQRDLARELDTTILEFEADGTWLGAPALRGALRDELGRILRRYLDFEIDWNRKLFGSRGNNPKVVRCGVEAHEVRFDDVGLNIDGVRVRFRGIIDRVERGVDDRLEHPERFVAAVDYKTSLGAIPGSGASAAWDDGVVLQVPIYARVLAELYPGSDVSRIEYRALRSPEAKLCLRLYQVDKMQVARESEADNETMVGALQAIGRHVTAARAGHFPARPAPSCGCPSYCPSLDVCRVAGGPKTKEW